jgi:hypothetical protein
MPKELNLPTAIVYIDGLNLYHRKLKQKPHLKWLNPLDLCRLSLPDYEVIKVKYFTSNVLGSMSDALAPTRQKTYLRALASLGSNFEIFMGRSVKDVRLARAYPQQQMPSGEAFKHKTIQSIEKESDVALAVQLVIDATKNRADAYFLMSNDSDFVPAIRYVTDECEGVIGLISPTTNVNKYLSILQWHSVRFVMDSNLKQSQFSDSLTDRWGEISKPNTWT